MKKRPIVSFLVQYDGEQEFLNRFLSSLSKHILHIPIEVIILCNGIDWQDSNDMNPVNNIHVIVETERIKPQEIVAKALTYTSCDFVVFHSTRDTIIAGYEARLQEYITNTYNHNVPLSLPYKNLTPSSIFSARPLLSGYCFPRDLLMKGLPFDLMFREDVITDAPIVKGMGDVVFTYDDIPLYERKTPYTVSLVVTIKNRLAHWALSMPSLVAQRGVEYELVLVDYYSEDGFQDSVRKYIEKNRPFFSSDLKQITIVHLTENKKFNSCKAKNLGARAIQRESNILAFSDIDTMLREDYLAYWCGKIGDLEKDVVSLRAKIDCRVSTEVNYGNMFIPLKLYMDVKGHNEDIQGYGGDDDEFLHRIRNAGGNEINPRTSEEARQYSVLHGDEQRIKYLEKAERSGLQNWSFLKTRTSQWTTGDTWGKQNSTIESFHI